MMNQKAKYWISLLMLALFCISMITGFIPMFMSHHYNSSEITFIWLFKHQWKVFHVLSSILLSIVVGIHFIDHLKWVVLMSKKSDKK